MDMCYLACVYRTPSGYCGSTGGAATCPHRQKKHTNTDRIREWSDEEIAEFTIGVMDSAFELFTGAKMPGENRRAMKKAWLDWLKQEVVNEQAD